MPDSEERTLARVIGDLQELDRLRSTLALTTYQASDPDYAQKFRLLDEIAKLLQPLSHALMGLASRQSSLATPALLDDPPNFERAAFHNDWPIVIIARIKGGERFNALVYLLDLGYALARHSRLDSGEDGFELVFHLSDETGQQFYCRDASHGTPEFRLTLRELKAICSSLPFGLVALQQRIEQEKAAIRDQMEQLVRSLEQTGV